MKHSWLSLQRTGPSAESPEEERMVYHLGAIMEKC
jgi:hypothetical protein